MTTRYFKSRAQAGLLLAHELLLKYANQNCSVIALSEGGIIVGAQIAMQLHANLMLLLTEKINLPGDEETTLGAMSSAGSYTLNNLLTAGQLEEYTSEYHNYLDQQRLEKFHRLNALMGHEGEINKDQLRRHVIILVSDGLINGLSIDVAADFLKPIKAKKLIIAAPIASVPAVDRMHLVGDEIYCLSVLENFVSINHYYDDNVIPDSDEALKIIKHIYLNWTGARPPEKKSDHVSHWL